MTDFRNRKVLITGAASGIGHLLALRIAARGGRLILWDVDAAHLAAVAAEIVAAGGQAAVVACNLAERESIEAAAARTLAEQGAIDVLINNAGIVDGKPLLEATDAEVERTFAVNVTSILRLSRAALELLERLLERQVAVLELFHHGLELAERLFEVDRLGLAGGHDGLRESVSVAHGWKQGQRSLCGRKPPTAQYRTPRIPAAGSSC